MIDYQRNESDITFPIQITPLCLWIQTIQKEMDASMKKAFQVKVRTLVRTLKEYKNYKAEVEAYDLNVVSQDKKKQEFYLESKSAQDQVEKKLIEYFHQLNSYLQQHRALIEEEEAAIDDYNTATAQIAEVKALLPGAC